MASDKTSAGFGDKLRAAREAQSDRRAEERAAAAVVEKRARRKGPRQVQVGLRTTDQAKRELHRLADRLDVNVVEAFEWAVEAAHEKLDKGRSKRG